MLAFEPYARLLHFLHLLAAVVSVASCVHLLVRMAKGRPDPRVRRHGLVLGVAYSAAWLLGATIYPTFRVRVRADFLDAAHPWATGLFEIKEHAATLALLPVLTIVLLTRSTESGTGAGGGHRRLVLGLASVVLGVLVYNASVGWYLGTLRSV
ncbi:MAG: hypothetical protein IPI67_10865 [Myxococcales bacterium]|nr:hypothetical protein [Myxococcales bacterium]